MLGTQTLRLCRTQLTGHTLPSLMPLKGGGRGETAGIAQGGGRRRGRETHHHLGRDHMVSPLVGIIENKLFVLRSTV